MTFEQNGKHPSRGGVLTVLALIALSAVLIAALSGQFGSRDAGAADTSPAPSAAELRGETRETPAPTEEAVCAHRWVDGVCDDCGAKCDHAWTDGVCVNCGAKCGHDHHDPQTRLCAACGLPVPHRYTRGVCALCGAAPEFVTTSLEDRFYEPVAQNAGTIEEVDYSTPKYAAAGRYSKTMTVYLPYNYDPAEKYDVFILCPGLSGRRKWLQRTFYESGHTMNGQNVLDNMILEGWMKPMIVAVIDVSVGQGEGRHETGDAQMGLELREAILPTLAEKYSTYAADGSYESLAAARAHFGIGGASNGSLYAYAAGCIRNLELFSNFVCMSGCTRAPAVRGRMNRDIEDEYPVYMFCSSAGDTDMTRKKTHNGFYTVIEDSPKFTEGENAFYVMSEGAHDWHVWYTGLFNFLPLLFPEQPAV